MRRARVAAGLTTIVTVVAGALLGALPAQAVSHDNTALSVSVAPAPAPVGSLATVTGMFTDTVTHRGISGSTVEIWRQTPGASGWAHVANGWTDSSGHYSAQIVIPGSVNVQARYSGIAWPKVISPVTLVKALASIASVSFSATPYHLLASGIAHAGAAGQIATLQINSGTGWITSAHATVGSNLKFSANVFKTPLVTYQARWLLGGGPDITSSVSNVGRVTVPAVTNTATQFTIAVYPDTQLETIHSPDSRYVNRADYLVANKTATNLKFMFSVGDNVEFDNTATTDDVFDGKVHPAHWQYGVVSNGLKPLERAKIPYSLAVGNHDSEATGGPQTGQNNTWGTCRTYPAGTEKCNNTYNNQRDTKTFNSYFTAARFGDVPTGGEFEAGKVDNIYSEFTAAAKTWMVLSLELWPRKSVITWANSVVAAHPHDNVIVVTHNFFNPGCGITDASKVMASGYQYGSSSPEYLWLNLVRKYANIKIVVSGHVGDACSTTLTGIHGNKIIGLLDCFHSTTTNPIRFLTFDTAANTLNTYIYGPGPKPTAFAGTATFAGMAWTG